MSKWAGAGREHCQTDSPSWPTGIFHTINVMLGWLGDRDLLSLFLIFP